MTEESAMWENVTLANGTMGDWDNDTYAFPMPSISPLDLFCSLLDVVICLSGLVGNGLVIFVVLRYTKMKTVTNTYILNLAIADVLFYSDCRFSSPRSWPKAGCSASSCVRSSTS